MMRYRTLSQFAVVIAAAVGPVGPARAQLESPPPPADEGADRGFPWLCAATAVAAIGGLYVMVRRREQAVEVDRKRGSRPEAVWYCRQCRRDVSGPECPRCRTPNPFAHEPAECRSRIRVRRGTSADRSPERFDNRGRSTRPHADEES